MNLNKKMVFLDIDGTILDHDKKIVESTRVAVAKLKENDIHVAIATGRAPFMLEEVRKELDIDCYVALNGAIAVYDEEIIFQKSLPKDHLIKLVEIANKKEHPLAFLTDKKAWLNAHSEHIEKALGSINMPIPEIDEKYYLNHPVYQTLLFCESDNDPFYIETFPEFYFVRWHEYSTDILVKGGSKAVGIQELVKRLGYQMKNVYAFGDGLNDIEMLQTVGTGVAMGNASDKVKDFADFVTKPVDEDGIYFGCKELGLI